MDTFILNRRPIISGLKLSMTDHLPHLLVLSPRCVKKMLHVHSATVVGRQKRRSERNIADVSTRNLKSPRYVLQIKVRFTRHLLGPNRLPDLPPVRFVGEGKLN